jgi:hypothetical protein
VSRIIETGSVILIAVAVLFGGRTLLFGISQYHKLSLVVLAVLFVLQTVAVRRNYARGGALAQLRASRDVAFIATIILAFIVVASPARWSIGATIAAFEFALVLDILTRLSPPARA